MGRVRKAGVRSRCNGGWLWDEDPSQTTRKWKTKQKVSLATSTWVVADSSQRQAGTFYGKWPTELYMCVLGVGRRDRGGVQWGWGMGRATQRWKKWTCFILELNVSTCWGRGLEHTIQIPMLILTFWQTWQKYICDILTRAPILSLFPRTILLPILGCQQTNILMCLNWCKSWYTTGKRPGEPLDHKIWSKKISACWLCFFLSLF